MSPKAWFLLSFPGIIVGILRQMINLISSNFCYSFAQRLVAHHRRNICWKCNRAQMFRTRGLVYRLVRGRYT